MEQDELAWEAERRRALGDDTAWAADIVRHELDWIKDEIDWRSVPRPGLLGMVWPPAKARDTQRFDDWYTAQMRKAGRPVKQSPATLEWSLGRGRLGRLRGRLLLRSLARLYARRGYRVTRTYTDAYGELNAVMRRIDEASSGDVRH